MTATAEPGSVDPGLAAEVRTGLTPPPGVSPGSADGGAEPGLRRDRADPAVRETRQLNED
jgi:hypothetical protein